jgi:hypothetical protein
MSAGPSWFPLIQVTSTSSDSLRIADRTFQWCLFSRRKSIESNTSPLRISRRVASAPRRTSSRNRTSVLAWQLSLPRWMSEMTTASCTAIP